MVFILPYGTDSSARLDLPEGILLAECGFPQRVPVDDLAAAVAAALAEPLDFPPLAQATTPCDCVVLPIAPGVPHAPCMIAAIVRTLLESGVKPDGITLLRTQLDVETDAPDPASDLPPELRAALTVRVHDPQDRAQLAYLAALDDGEPILLNRAITDADVVLPVGSISNRRADTYHGIHGTVYPTFSDHEALLRFRSPELLQHGKAEKKRLVKQCDQIGWLLGLNFTIQTVPGTGDEILHVLAGQSAAVRRKGASSMTRHGPVPFRAVPVWWSRPSRAVRPSKPGTTSARRWLRPAIWWRRTALLPCAATWLLHPARRSRNSAAPALARRLCGPSITAGPKTLWRPCNSPTPWPAATSIS